MKTRPKRIPKSVWTLQEKKKLVVALQKFGFADTSKLVEAVGTKDEAAIKYFIDCRTFDLAKEAAQRKRPHLADIPEQAPVVNPETPVVSGQPMEAVDKRPQEGIATRVSMWSTGQVWQKIARNQHLIRRKSEDYSMVICDLLKQFYEDEQESSGVDMVDIKSIYKYILDCSTGNIPSILKPLDSAIMLLLFRDVRQILGKYNFKEPKEFIEKFRSATRFVPQRIKQEATEGENEGASTSNGVNQQCDMDPDAIPIPREIYEELAKHMKVKDNINPLGVPLWLLAQNQEMISHFYR